MTQAYVVHLSHRQVKEADRVGGIELMLPWPADLPQPGVMDDDTECPASDQEREWVQDHVQPVCQAHGLVPVRVQVARAYGPHPDGARQQTRLAVIIIGRRWVHAQGARPPKTMWMLSDH